jgi:glycosyltransferase involved in cell wall biosynthesis
MMAANFDLTRATSTESRLRVLHLIESFGRGGAEILLADTLPLLIDRFDVRIRALAEPATLRADFRSAGVDASLVDETRPDGASWRHLAAQLRRELMRNPADIVHTHLFKATMVGRLTRIAMPAGPRLVTTLHNPDYSNPDWPSRIHGMSRQFIDWGTAVAANDSIVAVSAAVAADYRRHMGLRGPWGRIEVIHNAIDIDRYIRTCAGVDRAAARLAWGWAPEQFAVLSIGRLTDQKNFDALIDAVERIRARGIDAKALVFGQGPNRQRLERIAGNAVRFHGLASRDEVAAAMVACDVYVQPSRFEAFGMAILEAMAAARPVVATAVDGIREVVADNDTGILVPREDNVQFGEALIDLARDAEKRRRLGEAGRRRARLLFGVDTWVQRTSDLYMRLSRKH